MGIFSKYYQLNQPIQKIPDTQDNSTSTRKNTKKQQFEGKTQVKHLSKMIIHKHQKTFTNKKNQKALNPKHTVCYIALCIPHKIVPSLKHSNTTTTRKETKSDPHDNPPLHSKYKVYLDETAPHFLKNLNTEEVPPWKP